MMFPPAFLDSSSWNNTSQLQPTSGNITSAVAAGAEGNHDLLQDGLAPEGGGGGGGGDGSAPAKPMSMSERARLARMPQPETGLKCPRCDSANTKFCYFNNYSLTQPRHFCRACRRYWTRGGALRNVPVGGGYRRHAKRAKPKAAASAATGAAASAPAAVSSSTMAPSTLQAMLNSGASPFHPSLHRFADFDAASLGLSFPSKMFADTATDANNLAAGGSNGGAVHHQGMEQQWRAQAQMAQSSFPFFHAMDYQMGPGAPMPATMAMLPGMFHLGLETGGGGGGNNNRSEDGGGEFHHVMPSSTTKREEYPSSRGMYGNANCYNSYSGQ